MKDVFPLPQIPGYMDIREAARLLGVAESSVYRYVQSGRIPAYQAGHNIMVEEEALKQFKPGNTGRPRKRNAPWRTSPETSSFLVTYIQVQVRQGKEEEFKKTLWNFKQEDRYFFPGTVVRYISLDDAAPISATIQLVWKKSDMPEAEARKQELATFQHDLDGVLDWSTAHYRDGIVLLHT
jgi:excisionase family DNA binding protein